MSIHDIDASIENAKSRMGLHATSGRRGRSDRGKSRMAAAVKKEAARLLGTQRRPSMTKVLRTLGRFCAQHRHRPPSRATLYHFQARHLFHFYSASDLPLAARSALYNLDDGARVPGHQLVFYCFHYGDLAA